jgi:arylsulfatase A-like enzyme
MSGRPNILWIVTTQWRGHATGYAGDRNARTPALDCLASESENFVEAVTPHPFGPFARAAMLTGMLSPENGVRDYYDPLPPGTRTVAHDLSERGYTTAFLGKWHLGPKDPTVPLVGEAHAKTIVAPEFRGGFDFWEGFEGGFQLNDPWLHGTRLPTPQRFFGYQSNLLCQRASEHLVQETRAAKKPWFAVVSLEAPHPPYDAPAPGSSTYDPGALALRANVPTDVTVAAKARKELAGYYAHIEATDQAIGRLVAGLDPRNTVIVFTSVHGDMHGSHGLFRKGWPYEESVRVPLLVRPAGGYPGGGTSSSQLVSLVELRAFTNRCSEGSAEFPRREACEISMPSVVALPYQCDRVWRGTRSAKEKIIWNADGSPWLRFDLQDDPLELTNLFGTSN